MLREAYRDYLLAGATPGHAERLADVLAGSPYAEAGELLRHYAREDVGVLPITTGANAGRSVFIGSRPPVAGVGSYWFDVVDLTLSLLLPQYIDPDDREDMTPEALARADENKTWFAMRPVARFQFGAFLDVAPIEQVGLRAPDQARILAGSELDPVTSLTCHQASLYLYWFGKFFATDFDWQSAHENFGVAPWVPPNREWIGGSRFNSAYCVVISPATVGLDPREMEDETGARRMLYEENEAPADVTFRSALKVIYGLSIDSSLDSGGARVPRKFARPA